MIEFPKALELDLVVIYPSKLDYELALKLSTELLRIGKPVPAIDAIIAAIALNTSRSSKKLEKTLSCSWIVFARYLTLKIDPYARTLTSIQP